MKKILLLLILVSVSIASFDASAVRLNEEYYFGDKKGKKIGTSEDILREALKNQITLLKNIIDEQKKTNDLLKKQLDLLDGSKKDKKDIMIAVIRELAKSTREQNKLLKELVNKK